MTAALRRRSPGPGQLVLLLPGLPDPRPQVNAGRRPRAPQPPRHPVAPRGPLPPGELRGAASTSRQVRTLLLSVEHTPDNRYRLTLPRQVPSWSAVVSSPQQLTVAFRSAFTEVQCAAYSEWKNHLYDGEIVTYRRRRKKRSAPKKKRNDVHPFEAWKLTGTADARGVPVWVSPGAKRLTFPEDAQVVQRIIAKREKAGLARRPDATPLEPVTPDNVVNIRRRRSA